MSQTPEPPPYGTPPPVYAPPPRNSNRTVDVTMSWILYVLQILGSLAMAVVALFAVFLTDSCGSGGTVPSRVCDTGYLGSVIFGYWIVLLVLLIGTPIGIIVATARKRSVWPWSVGGAALSTIATIVFFVLVAN